MILFLLSFHDLSCRGKTNLARALEVLHRFATSINPADALRVLPRDIPMAALSQYLQHIVPFTVHRRRHAQVVKSLSKMDNLQVIGVLRTLSLTLTTGKERFASITESTDRH